jgi:hypothetical protein
MDLQITVQPHRYPARTRPRAKTLKPIRDSQHDQPIFIFNIMTTAAHSHDPYVLILGATGHTGLDLIDGLIRSGGLVRAMASDNV